ncbi:MAG: hypothetical protein NTW86_06840, partial [Candidatus Sumerlaeota bacterium]|nr:hypothetical protein [Candidatus Sumerlaeota bacterium]
LRASALPREMAGLGGFSYALRVDARGGRAIVADSGVGVRLVDVADPSAPALEGLYAGIDPYDAHLGFDLAYASNPDQGVATIDISQPLFPTTAAMHEKTSGAAYGFRVSDDGAVAAIAAYPYGLKLTDPRPGGGELLGIGQLWVSPLDAALLGDTAYVVGDDEGLIVYDVSNPSAPVEVRRVDLPRGRRINVDANRKRAYVAAGEHGVYLFDLTDPRSPSLISNLRLNDARDFEPAGDRFALAAEGPYGMAVIDLADPAVPRLLYRTAPSPGDLLEDIAVDGRFAYLAYGQAGLIILLLDPLLSANNAARNWMLFQ